MEESEQTARVQFSRFQIPGFSLPLEFAPNEIAGNGGDLLSNALGIDSIFGGVSAEMPLTTTRELTMLRLMNELTDKPGWEIKVFDDSIAGKWKTEAMATPGVDVTQNMADYVIEELRYKAGIFNETGSVNVYIGDVVKSDGAIPETLREQLRTHASRLEDVPDVRKDYHPGSDGMLLDLVHPSLFPLVYGRSRILPDSLATLENCMDKCGEGVITQVPPSEKPARGGITGNSYSRNFQWLPCEVEFAAEEGTAQGNVQVESKNGDEQGEGYPKCKITSYINNLHPHCHPDLYGCIERILARVVPQWNRTLGPLKIYNYNEELRIHYRSCTYEGEPEESPKIGNGESEDDFSQRLEEWEARQRIRRLVLPEPGQFNAPTSDDAKKFDLQKEFGHRGLQVIVKLANIHLTPEKPRYEGGSWHVEGQMNEHICATALYYYDSENITESRLGFRQQVDAQDPEVDYEQEEHEWLEKVFGCNNGDRSIQNVGDVVCKQGRLITFPNILQHQVQPFQLQDASKPGHRKILALFLVDPNIRVISTANVPPQQRDWWGDEIKSTRAINVFPEELQEEVIRAVDEFPISMDEAKEIRLKLMDERKKYVVSQTDAFEAGEFSLCEH